MGNVIKLVKNKYKDEEPIQKLLTLIEDDFIKVNKLINEQVVSHVDRIPDVSNHIIELGGKRLRPILTLTTSKICEYRGDYHINLAAAVELMHTATLLVGDFLLGKAFQLMVETKSLECLQNLSNASAKIAEGEVMQLIASDNIKTTEDQYMNIIEAKTAELFSTACVVGALIAQSNEEEINALISFGKNLGIAFQLKDDALDYSGDKETLGKNIGEDFLEGKVTLPIILAYRRGNNSEREFLENSFNNKIRNKELLKNAIKVIKQYNTIEDTLLKAHQHGRIAKDALAIFPETEFKEALMKLVDFSIIRSN